MRSLLHAAPDKGCKACSDAGGEHCWLNAALVSICRMTLCGCQSAVIWLSRPCMYLARSAGQLPAAGPPQQLALRLQLQEGCGTYMLQQHIVSARAVLFKVPAHLVEVRQLAMCQAVHSLASLQALDNDCALCIGVGLAMHAHCPMSTGKLTTNPKGVLEL